jgi:5-methylcytosine-specific restriction endonuclease McrA
MKKDNSENRLYCSDSCKEECPIYKKTSYILMKEDAIRAGRLNWIELNREVQPELRQMVFKRDDYKCIKCGSKENLHCHHIEGIRWEPLESADIDKCITVCKTCHKEIHMKKDCGYNDLKCKEI